MILYNYMYMHTDVINKFGHEKYICKLIGRKNEKKIGMVVLGVLTAMILVFTSAAEGIQLLQRRHRQQAALATVATTAPPTTQSQPFSTTTPATQAKPSGNWWISLVSLQYGGNIKYPDSIPGCFMGPGSRVPWERN